MSTTTEEETRAEARALGIPEPLIEILEEIEDFANEVNAFNEINDSLNNH